jgi:hypothetical protein
MGKVNSVLTFGLELECVKLSKTALSTIESLSFERHLDHSIKGDNGETLPRTWPGAGHEIVTKPMAMNVSMNGDGTKCEVSPREKVTELVKKLASCSDHVNSSCGIHLHLGKPNMKNGELGTTSSWSPDEVRTMLIIGQILEPRLMDLVHASRRNNDTCQSISKRYLKSDFGKFYPVGKVDPNKYSNTKRYCWLNLIETARKGNRSERGYGSSPATGTIEVRLLGETHCPNYIDAWTQLWLNIGALVACASSTLAISQICYSDILEPLFFAVQCAKTADEKQRSLSSSHQVHVGGRTHPRQMTSPRPTEHTTSHVISRVLNSSTSVSAASSIIAADEPPF